MVARTYLQLKLALKIINPNWLIYLPCSGPAVAQILPIRTGRCRDKDEALKWMKQMFSAALIPAKDKS